MVQTEVETLVEWFGVIFPRGQLEIYNMKGKRAVLRAFQAEGTEVKRN